MQEEFIHYVWKFKKYDFGNSKTTSGLPLTIIDAGTLNQHSGPDFFNSKIRIDDQTWAGNVEIHIKASDWYVHRHEKDPAYENVILHVVWEDDLEVFRNDNTVIPTLKISELVKENTLENYQNLLMRPVKEAWINCERDFGKFSDFDINNRLEPLYFERLQARSGTIKELLKISGNDWEAVLFWMLAKNFGLNVNGEVFMQVAKSFDFSLLRKLSDSRERLEALLFGQARMLEEQVEDVYYKKLQQEFVYLKRKYALESSLSVGPKFFRLRPDNFPNIRLSQLAGLYHKQAKLFAEILKTTRKSQLYELLSSEAGAYWQEHYTFSKSHGLKTKNVSKSFMDLLIINTIIPLRFCYLQETGSGEMEALSGLLEDLRAEKNSVIEKFNKLRPGTAVNALQSQGLLQLKKEYCDKNACLKCSLGIKILQGMP